MALYGQYPYFFKTAVFTNGPYRTSHLEVAPSVQSFKLYGARSPAAPGCAEVPFRLNRLLHSVREAVRTGKRRLEMGDTFADFIRQLGLDPSRGGIRRDTKRLRDQMSRLFSAAINFQSNRTEENGRQHEANITMTVTSRRERWWDPKRPDQVNLFGSWVEL